jgi:HEPN/Toprim N-terminal domain 1
MGTYCELYVADYPVFSSKSQASPIVMTLFRERDKRAFDRKCVERNQIEWGHANWDPTEVERVVEYTASVREVRDRLRVMGFTLSRALASRTELSPCLTMTRRDTPPHHSCGMFNSHPTF